MAGYLPFDDPNLMTVYKKIQRAEVMYPSWFSPGAKKLIRRILDIVWFVASTVLALHVILLSRTCSAMFCKNSKKPSRHSHVHPRRKGKGDIQTNRIAITDSLWLSGMSKLWCTEAKGLVFGTMLNPVSTILVAIIAYFVLAEKLYIGSIIGAIVVIFGIYLFFWGKEEHKPA